MSPAVDTPVLIVGAGPVGSALAMELLHQGLACVLVDDGIRDASPQVGAKALDVRSMGLFRRWGLAGGMRAAAPIPAGYSASVCYVTSLSGYLLARLDNVLLADLARYEQFPEPALRVPQPDTVRFLRGHVGASSLADVRLGWRLNSFEGDGDAVRVELEECRSGRSETVVARWLVGCDGARSLVRQKLGIEAQGQGELGVSLNAVIQSPELLRLNRHGWALHWWVMRPKLPPIIVTPLDTHGAFALTGVGWRGDGDPVEAVAAMVAAAAGGSVAYQLVDVEPWRARCLMAAELRRGRVFLAGDAAHQHPPTGGHGMNMGIGDGVDLGWKLAAVEQAWGGDRLLDTYQTERGAVHRLVVDEAQRAWRRLPAGLLNDDFGGDDDASAERRRVVGETLAAVQRTEYESLGLQLGVSCGDSQAIVSDGTSPPPVSVATYTPSATPGCLAPHAWLADGRALSDLFGPRFTLLSFAGDSARGEWPAVRQVQVDDPAIRAMYGADHALIRPDHVVAWRGDALPPDMSQLLAHVTLLN